jgi:Tfp pilus assembly PilM family ATPase
MEAGLMAESLIGLDISSHTIKAVLFNPGGITGGRILAVRTLDINACGGIDEALKKLAEDKRFSNHSCVVSLPPSDVMFRQVNLPFHDDYKIKKTLAFELEPLIPQAIDEVIADYLAIPRDGLLVAALTKKNIREWIEKVKSHLGEVSIIDISSTVLASQILAGKTSAACGIILDIGATSTAAAFYENGAMVQIRSLAFGGELITAALAEDLSVERDTAEQLKIKSEYTASCAAVDSVCRQFCSELKNTIEYMRLNGSLQNDPAHMTVTGGGALFVPLQKALEISFSLPLEVLDLIRLKQLEMDEDIRRECPPQIMNTAIASALRTFAGRKSFNFRQGEFAAKDVRFNLKGQLKWAAMIAGIIFLLGIVNQILDYSLKTRRLNVIKKQIVLIFEKDSPETKNMVDPVQQLKTKLTEDKKTFGFYKGNTGRTVLTILKEISSLIPPSLDIVMTNLSYENSIVSMKGEAKKTEDIAAVKNELLKSRYFKDVTMGSTSLAKDGGKIDFDLRIELK